MRGRAWTLCCNRSCVVPGARGLIIGGHEQESDLGRVKALAAELGIADRVTFTGHVAPRDVDARLAEARVLVLPNPASAISTRFTSPLKLFEYMAARRPIVATSLPAIREVLRDEVNALLVEPGDADRDGERRSLACCEISALAERLAEAAYKAAPAVHLGDAGPSGSRELISEVVTRPA